MTTADDASYKLLFSAPELVRDLVLGFIPDAWLHSLDYATLEKVPGSYVTDDLRQRADDVIWRVKADGQWVYLYYRCCRLCFTTARRNGRRRPMWRS